VGERRSWLVVGALVVLLAVLAVDDRRAHAAEATQVARCVSTVADARVLAAGRVSAMASYVRPAFSRRQLPPETRTGLAGLVAGAARQAVPTLESARSTCAAVGVRPWHGDLGGHLDGCLAVLDAGLAWLDEVARDGAAVFRSAPEQTAGCGAT
jgi:hypothetical protein